MLISVLIVKVFLLAFESELSSAHTPVVNTDSNSNTGSLLYQIIDGLYDELKNDTKEMTEKIDKFEEKKMTSDLKYYKQTWKHWKKRLTPDLKHCKQNWKQ